MNGVVGAHTERYVAAHGDRHPFTDCWIPAGGAVIWAGDDDWHIEHSITAVTEAMRLCMARYDTKWPDLSIDAARDELAYWIQPGFPAQEPVPGSATWPAPTGPYAQSWRRLFQEADQEAVLLAASRAEEVLGLLLTKATCHHPGSPTVFGCVLKEFRPTGSRPFFGVVVDACRNRTT
ncbi:hypothetical protein ACFC8F_03090 [Streptomyces hydrogenans]|uniref:hypothetical protein n=1 Tax=Streptomyces hydrogenans TaxID=1873719 RepID=UPI0035DCF2D1